MPIVWLSYALVAVALLILAITQHQLRPTTLVAPCRWALVSLAALVATEAALEFSKLMPQQAEAWRFLVAASTLCPGIALLGAKRPQSRPWQWIVASLWLIIALPAIQQIALNKTGSLEIHPARACFMLGLILFTTANSIVSRYWPAVLMAVCGQVALMSPMLPYPFHTVHASMSTWGLVSIASAILLAKMGPRRSPGWLWRTGTGEIAGASSIQPQPPTEQVPPRVHLDRLWLDFRNAFGVVWSLRVMEQINAVSHSNRWNVALHWSGFRASNGSPDWELPPEQLRVLRQSLHNLLRRFVSADWIESRL